MFSWWGMVALAALLAVWFHWESGVWRLTRHALSFAAADIGTMMFVGLAVYVTAA